MKGKPYNGIHHSTQRMRGDTGASTPKPIMHIA